MDRQKMIILILITTFNLNFFKPITAEAIVGVDDVALFLGVGTLLAGTYAISNDEDLSILTEDIINGMSDGLKTVISGAYNSGSKTWTITKDNFNKFIDYSKSKINNIITKPIYKTTLGGLNIACLDLSKNNFNFSLNQYAIKSPFLYKGTSISIQKGASTMSMFLNDKQAIMYQDYTIGDSKFKYNVNFNVVVHADDEYILVPYIDYFTGVQGFGTFKKDTLGYKLANSVTCISTETTVITQPKEKIDEKILSGANSLNITKVKEITEVKTDNISITDEKGVTVNPSKVLVDFSPITTAGGALKRVFPFSLPWDLVSVIKPFNAEPKAPHWEFSFKDTPLKSDAVIVIDFEQFSTLAVIVRNFVYIIFLIGLILLTRNIIGG